MGRLILHRIGLLVLALWGLGTLVFFLIHLIPGDPVTVMLGDYATPGDVQRLRHELGLDRPLLDQYRYFWSRLFRGDLGRSIFTQTPIAPELFRRLRMTALLAAASMLFALVVSLPLAGLAAYRRGTGWDRLIVVGTTVGVAMPSFWMAPLLMLLFSVHLGWLPVSGSGTWKHLVLPALTLGSGLAAYLTRISRTSILDTLQQPFVRAARARGLPRVRLITAHILKPAAIPIVTVVGLQTGALLTGTVITETIFAWPGLGRYLIEGIYARDYPIVQACVLLFGLIYAVTNTLVDLLYLWLDPRTRTGLEAAA